MSEVEVNVVDYTHRKLLLASEYEYSWLGQNKCMSTKVSRFAECKEFIRAAESNRLMISKVTISSPHRVLLRSESSLNQQMIHGVDQA